VDRPVTTTDEAATAAERRALEIFLDSYRQVVVSSVAGLSEADARRRLVPSLTTVSGLLKHLRWVEVGWFHQLLGERAGDNRRSHDRSWEFVPAPDETLDRLVLHLIEETARHAGHLDILLEQLDGRTATS
jgi:uncharacterized damage-inducible protein DinB